jgi:hypothetical protein
MLYNLAGCSGPAQGFAGLMKRWLSSSVALIAVLLYFWLVLTKPICRDGFAASLGKRSGWTCVANANWGRLPLASPRCADRPDRQLPDSSASYLKASDVRVRLWVEASPL